MVYIQQQRCGRSATNQPVTCTPEHSAATPHTCWLCVYVAGLPREAIQDVYRAAITKAGSTDTQQHLSNGFVAALTQIDDVNSGQELLDNLLAAVEATIKSSGCAAAQKFTQGRPWQRVHTAWTAVSWGALARRCGLQLPGMANAGACEQLNSAHSGKGASACTCSNPSSALIRTNQLHPTAQVSASLHTQVTGFLNFS